MHSLVIFIIVLHLIDNICHHILEIFIPLIHVAVTMIVHSADTIVLIAVTPVIQRYFSESDQFYFSRRL